MRIGVWVAAATLVCTSAAAQSPAPDKERARVQFREGLKRAEAGDLRAALESFRAAYAASPHFSVLYNIAQTQLALDLTAEAVGNFERYLADGGAHVPASRREQVLAAIAVGRGRLGRTEGGGAPSPSRVGQVQIHCETPDMEVFVDDVAVARTPLASPLLTDVGEHRLRLVRAGYAPFERSLLVQEKQLSSVTCSDRPIAPLPPMLSAALQVQATPSWAEVLIDGRAFSGSALVAGRHQLRVQADGHVAQERIVALGAGKLSQLTIQLEPTLRERQRVERARSHRKSLGYVLGGSGLGMLVTGGGLLIWNQGRYDDWQNAMGSDSAGNVDQAVAIQRVDDLSLGLMIVGTGLAGTAAWLLFGGEDK